MHIAIIHNQRLQAATTPAMPPIMRVQPQAPAPGDVAERCFRRKACSSSSSSSCRQRHGLERSFFPDVAKAATCGCVFGRRRERCHNQRRVSGSWQGLIDTYPRITNQNPVSLTSLLKPKAVNLHASPPQNVWPPPPPCRRRRHHRCCCCGGGGCGGDLPPPPAAAEARLLFLILLLLTLLLPPHCRRPKSVHRPPQCQFMLFRHLHPVQ